MSENELEKLTQPAVESDFIKTCRKDGLSEEQIKIVKKIEELWDGDPTHVKPLKAIRWKIKSIEDCAEKEIITSIFVQVCVCLRAYREAHLGLSLFKDEELKVYWGRMLSINEERLDYIEEQLKLSGVTKEIFDGLRPLIENYHPLGAYPLSGKRHWKEVLSELYSFIQKNCPNSMVEAIREHISKQLGYLPNC